MKIQLRNDTATNWQLSNPILIKGEFGVEWDTGKFKIGNGTSNYNDLDFIGSAALDILAKIKTVDGVSSGLDADLLDGQDGAYYLAAANLTGSLLDTSILGQLTLGSLTASQFLELDSNNIVISTVKSDAFNKPFGTVAGTVSEGNHTHTSFQSDVTLAGNLLPDIDNVRSLGSATQMWKDIFVGPGSLYLNGQKVLEDTQAGTIRITADNDQNISVQTGGTGDIELSPLGTGLIQLKGPVLFQTGSIIRSADGSALNFDDSIEFSAGEGIVGGLTIDGYTAYHSGNFDPQSSIVDGSLSIAKTSGLQTALDSKQVALGYTPVQQGTGIGQLGNNVKLGWKTGSKLGLTIDATDIGNVAIESWVQTGLDGKATSAQGAKADTALQPGYNITIAGSNLLYSLDSGNSLGIRTGGVSGSYAYFTISQNGSMYAPNGTFYAGGNPVWHAGNYDPTTKASLDASGNLLLANGVSILVPGGAKLSAGPAGGTWSVVQGTSSSNAFSIKDSTSADKWTWDLNLNLNTSKSASFGAVTASGLGLLGTSSGAGTDNVVLNFSSNRYLNYNISGDYFSFSGARLVVGGSVSATGDGGFLSSTYAINARNPIFRFGNADGYGISYFQGSAGFNGADSIGIHFGTSTSAGSVVNISADGLRINGSIVWHAGNYAATSTAADANTVAQRDASGDIYVRRLYASDIHNAAATWTGVPSRIAMEQASDGYIRWQTPTALKTNIGIVSDNKGINADRRYNNAYFQSTTLGSGFYTNSGDGLYNAAGSAIVIGGWCHVWNGYHDSNGYATQLAFPYGSNQPYVRSSNGTSWQEWMKIAVLDTGGSLSIPTNLAAGNNVVAGGLIGGLRLYAGWDSGVSGSVSCNSWFRSTGNTGLYCSDYAGGVYMTDVTYLRSYNNKAMMASDFVISSDRRLKAGIRPFEYKGRLSPKSYVYRADGRADFGFIAQDVQELYPDAVGELPETGMLQLSYGKLTAVLSHQINKAEDDIQELELENKQLRSDLTDLMNRFDQANIPWWKKLLKLFRRNK